MAETLGSLARPPGPAAVEPAANGRSAVRERFAREYGTVRRAEGWGSHDAAYYRALPFRDLTGRNEHIWRIRARSFALFVEAVLQPLEAARPNAALSVVDLGAGNGWLAYRLAQRGHHVAAIDLLLDPLDGLGAVRHYDARFQPIQAEFDHLPLADATADLALFNASLHYSPDYATTLHEALRVLRADGRLAILDSPLYHRVSSGVRMVRERQAQFVRDYGFASDALGSEGFLSARRLQQLGTELGVEWRVLEARRSWRAAFGQRLQRLRLGREPARFPVIVGRRVC
jgi:SAM-dependent methyltransferase